jgi:predicted HD phosphohydrolase
VVITPFSSVDELLVSIESVRDERGDDVVPARTHLLQTAEVLDALHPEDPELVVAGLVHDIASALGLREGEHELLGAQLVTPLLGLRVAALVAGHVDAKRYLVATEPGYGHLLSDNSAVTLHAQGGAMDESEVAAFENRTDCEAMVALRRADDAAKVPDARVRPVAEWRGLLDELASAIPPAAASLR